MKKIQILHNTRCGKSRNALQLLQNEGYEVEIIEYLKNTPTKKDLQIILDKLGLKPQDVIRKKESIYLEKFKNKTFTDSEWLQILIEYPILIERPIVIDGYKAVIARPPELAVELVNRKS